MKRILAGILVALLLCAACAALAEEQTWLRWDVGTIIEVLDDGNLLIEAQADGDLIAVVSEATKVIMQGDPAPGMVVDVRYENDNTSVTPREVDAVLLRQAAFQGHVTDIDKDEGLAQITANGGFYFYMVWVELPKATELDELVDKAVSFYAYRELGDPVSMVVQAMDYQVVDSVTGTVTEIGDGYLMMDIDGNAVRIVLTDETVVALQWLQVDYTVEVYFVPVDGAESPDEIIALSVTFGNG